MNEIIDKQMIITKLNDEKKLIENNSTIIRETLLVMRRELQDDLKGIRKIKW